MWTCINCFPDKKRSDRIDLFLLLLFCFLLPPLSPSPKKGRNLQYREKSLSHPGAHLWKKMTACKITGPKIIPWTTMYLGDFFVYSHLHPVSRMNWKALLWELCWSLRNYGRCRLGLRSTRVARLPSPASSGSSSCVDEAQLPKTSTTTQTGCFYSIKLTLGDVVEMPRILRCSVRYTIDNLAPAAKQSGILEKQKYIHPRQYLQAEKDIFTRQTADLNLTHGLCCLPNEFAVGCPKLPDKLCTYSLFALHTGKRNAW